MLTMKHRFLVRLSVNVMATRTRYDWPSTPPEMFALAAHASASVVGLDAVNPVSGTHVALCTWRTSEAVVAASAVHTTEPSCTV